MSEPTADAVYWIGLFLFLSVYVLCDTWLYSQGHDTFLWSHKTEAEKQIQQQKCNPQQKQREVSDDPTRT